MPREILASIESAKVVWGQGTPRPPDMKPRRINDHAIAMLTRQGLCDGRLGGGECEHYRGASNATPCGLILAGQGCANTPAKLWRRCLTAGGHPSQACRWYTTKVTKTELIDAGLIPPEV